MFKGPKKAKITFGGVDPDDEINMFIRGRMLCAVIKNEHNKYIKLWSSYNECMYLLQITDGWNVEGSGL